MALPTDCPLYDAAESFIEEGTGPNPALHNTPMCGIGTCCVCTAARHYSIAERAARGMGGLKRRGWEEGKTIPGREGLSEIRTGLHPAKDTMVGKELAPG